MDVTEFLGKVQIAYKGKGAHKAPAFGTVKCDLYLSIANSKLRSWADDPEYIWNTLFSVEELVYGGGPVAVPTGFIKLADAVELVSGNDKLILSPVPVEHRNDYKNAVYLSGHSPKKISFTSDVPAIYLNQQLIVPCCIYPPKLVKATDLVVIDNTEWLINITAAELARNDPAKDDQFNNLIGLANVEYKKMQDAARAIVYTQPNSIPRRNTGFNIGGNS